MDNIDNKCPVCKANVKGDEENSYYCERCNLLFKKKDLKMHRIDDKQEEE